MCILNSREQIDHGNGLSPKKTYGDAIVKDKGHAIFGDVYLLNNYQTQAHIQQVSQISRHIESISKRQDAHFEQVLSTLASIGTTSSEMLRTCDRKDDKTHNVVSAIVSLNPTESLAPGDDFEWHCTIAARRRSLPNLCINESLVLRKLNQWVTTEGSASFLAQASGKSEQRLGDLAAEVLQHLKNSSLPVIWCLDSHEKGEYTVLDITTHLLIQALRQCNKAPNMDVLEAENDITRRTDPFSNVVRKLQIVLENAPSLFIVVGISKSSNPEQCDRLLTMLQDVGLETVARGKVRKILVCCSKTNVPASMVDKFSQAPNKMLRCDIQILNIPIAQLRIIATSQRKPIGARLGAPVLRSDV